MTLCESTNETRWESWFDESPEEWDGEKSVTIETEYRDESVSPRTPLASRRAILVCAVALTLALIVWVSLL